MSDLSNCVMMYVVLLTVVLAFFSSLLCRYNYTVEGTDFEVLMHEAGKQIVMKNAQTTSCTEGQATFFSCRTFPEILSSLVCPLGMSASQTTNTETLWNVQ